MSDRIVIHWRDLCSHCGSKLSAKNAKIARPTLNNYIYTRDELEHYSDKLWKMMIDEKLSVRIYETYPLEDVARAHTVSVSCKYQRACLTGRQQDIESRKTVGKLLLKP